MRACFDHIWKLGTDNDFVGRSWDFHFIVLGYKYIIKQNFGLQCNPLPSSGIVWDRGSLFLLLQVIPHSFISARSTGSIRVTSSPPPSTLMEYSPTFLKWRAWAFGDYHFSHYSRSQLTSGLGCISFIALLWIILLCIIAFTRWDLSDTAESTLFTSFSSTPKC